MVVICLGKHCSGRRTIRFARPTGDDELMTEKNTNQERLAGDTPSALDKLVKKPYARPEFRYERAFETMALSCGKIRAQQAICRFNRKTS